MAADYITDTNENDGVAKAIERFVLNNWFLTFKLFVKSDKIIVYR
jgi:hypothetical protein